MIGRIMENALPLAYSIFNILAVTAIVIINKRVFRTFGFNFPILLVTIHVCVTFLGMRMAAAVGFFERKSLDFKQLAILAGSFVLYNAASLINLNVNTVGFYQVSKILVTPTVMLINFLAFQKSTSTETKQAVGVMLIGVTLATVSDVDVNFIGFMVGMLAVFGAAQSQILIGHMQKKLEASANQLLVAYTPVVVPMLLIVSPLDLTLPANEGEGFAAYARWYENNCSTEAVITIGVSACLGLLVSLSTFLLIGATSALTYNIVGHTKTMLILIMGVVVFGDFVSSKKLAGIAVALCGVFWYSKIKLSEQAAAKSRSASLPTTNPKN